MIEHVITNDDVADKTNEIIDVVNDHEVELEVHEGKIIDNADKINGITYKVTEINSELNMYESENHSFLSGIVRVGGGGGAVKNSSLPAPQGYKFSIGAVGTIGTGGYHTQKYADISSMAIDINQSGSASIIYVYKNAQASAFSSVITDYFNIRVYMPLLKI